MDRKIGEGPKSASESSEGILRKRRTDAVYGTLDRADKEPLMLYPQYFIDDLKNP